MDRKELEKWLKGRPREDAILIAQRAALRVFPFWASRMGQDWTRKRDLTSTLILRSLIASGVAHKYSTREVKKAAAAAAAAANAFASAANAATADAANANAAAAAANAAAAAAAAANAANAGAAAHSYSAAVDAAAVAVAARRLLWTNVEQDVAALTQGQDLALAPIWYGADVQVNPSTELKGLGNLARETGDRNSFWHRWWFAMKSGKPMDWDLQRDVALIPEEVWRAGPKAVIATIEKIEHAYSQAADPIAQDLARLPDAPAEQLQVTQQAMERNRQALPPTFDAIEGLLLLEIERLQQKNDKDEDWKRQMRVYLTLYEAVCQLRANFPAKGVVKLDQAKKSESLVRLYLKRFAELPRAKVDEVVEGTWSVGRGAVQAGLIGATTALAVSYGLPVMAGVTIATMVFAPKNAADLVKAAREAVTGGKSP